MEDGGDERGDGGDSKRCYRIEKKNFIFSSSCLLACFISIAVIFFQSNGTVQTRTTEISTEREKGETEPGGKKKKTEKKKLLSLSIEKKNFKNFGKKPSSKHPCFSDHDELQRPPVLRSHPLHSLVSDSPRQIPKGTRSCAQNFDARHHSTNDFGQTLLDATKDDVPPVQRGDRSGPGSDEELCCAVPGTRSDGFVVDLPGLHGA